MTQHTPHTATEAPTHGAPHIAGIGAQNLREWVNPLFLDHYNLK